MSAAIWYLECDRGRYETSYLALSCLRSPGKAKARLGFLSLPQQGKNVDILRDELGVMTCRCSCFGLQDVAKYCLDDLDFSIGFELYQQIQHPFTQELTPNTVVHATFRKYASADAHEQDLWS